MKKLKEKLQPIFLLFSMFEIILYSLIIAGLAGGYIHLMIGDVVISVIFGIVAMIVLFYGSVYEPRRIRRHQELLKDLQKYTTAMTFYLSSRSNVMQAMEEAKRGLDQQIQDDLDRTIEILNEKAEVHTDHFKKYNFPSLDIFHQQLKIKYEVGGEAKELFARVNKSVNFEIVKRDEMIQGKSSVRMRVLMMFATVMAMPAIIRLMASDIYFDFLYFGSIGVMMNLIFGSAIVMSIFFLQKSTLDISVR